MELRRGFKSEAHRLAREIRQELGLGVAAPIDAWVLAKHLAIPVLRLSSFRENAPVAVRQLTQLDPSAFSACTVCLGYRKLVVLNDAHHPNRHASSLAHELAHILLWHTPSQSFGREGVREWNAAQEAEAEWFAGALLISDEAALEIVRTGKSTAEAAEAYGVSERMVTFRLNVTGARRRVARGYVGRRRHLAS
jgi:Zn-dependent peptidase ImmA (M78 family)